MPELSADELKASIANREIFAVSIDTVVFDAKGKRFDHPVLRRLVQFKRRDVEVVIADVVAEEMKAHLREDAAKTQRALKRALRLYDRRWRRQRGEGERSTLLDDADPGTFANAELHGFLESVGGRILPVTATPGSAQRILEMYFSAEPPFGAGRRRKSEFPDAYALLTLEAHAAAAGKLLLCASADKGWRECAARSDYLVCVSEVEEALALFNAADDQHVAEAIVHEWRELEAVEMMDEVERAFELLQNVDFQIVANTDIDFEAEPIVAVVQWLNFETIARPKAIDVDGNTVTFTVGVEALVSFEASFEFFVAGIEKDRVVASRNVSVDRTVPLELTIKAARSLENGPVFHEVDVDSGRFEVDFGYIEVFPGEDPTHEKY